MLRATRRTALVALLSVPLSTAVITAVPGPATAAAVSATVVGPLNVRAAASSAATLVGRLPDRAKVALVCQVSGQNIKGAVRTTSQWDRLTSGAYISHGYVRLTAKLPACPAPKADPMPASTPARQTNAQFIASAVAPAQRNQREYGVPASVTIAQAILESGWGRSGLTANDRNYFGIKCFNHVPGPIAAGCHRYVTSECLPACAPTTAEFRTYRSMTDSFRDHGRFLTVNPRYQPAFAHTANADLFLYHIWKAGYATSPTYVANVRAVMVKYDLYRYDIR